MKGEKMQLGLYNGKVCSVSEYASNKSVCITGLSGTGKTTHLYKMEMACAKDGDTVVVIDINQTHQNEQIMESIKSEYLELTNRIDAIKDGLGIELLSPLESENGDEESFVHIVNSAVKAFSASQNMGIRQVGELRKAIIEAKECRNDFETEADAIASCLAESESDFAQTVYEKLWTILKCGALRPSLKSIDSAKINILDMSANDTLTQVALTELFLADIWRKIQFQKSCKGHQKIVIIIDEFQELMSKKSEMLKTMLCQGRKYGISMLLATQTLSIFKKETVSLLNQTATRLYFRPAVNEVIKVAREIGVSDIQEIAAIIRHLGVGELLAVGDLCVEGMEIRRPLLLK